MLKFEYDDIFKDITIQEYAAKERHKIKDLFVYDYDMDVI